MSYFYTNFSKNKNKVLVRGYRDGKRFNEEVRYKPYLFISSKNDSDYKDVYGNNVSKKHFDNMFEAQQFGRQYKEIPNFNVYGYPNFEYVYINDEFNSDIEPDMEAIKVGNFDIETDSENGYGSIEYADKAIITISLKVFNEKTVYAFGTKEYTSTRFDTDSDIKIKYIKCHDEKEMLLRFLTLWKKLDFDIVTGWNIDYYDIPYIINRITLLFDEDRAKQLSPYGIINSREIVQFGRTVTMYEIVGISSLDYMQAYKKFTFGNEESYKLDFICKKVLGLGKLDYSEHKTLANLYKNDFNMFMDYNVLDVWRVEQLDLHMKFIEQIITIALNAKVNFTDTFTTVRIWDVIIHNHLMKRNVVVPFSINEKTILRQIAGGYVKESLVGPWKWVVSFDLTSLYPMLMIMYNISPEKYLGQHPKFANYEYSVDQVIKGEVQEMLDKLQKTNTTITGKGTVFSKNGQGFIPEIMKDLFDQRAKYKNEMKESDKMIVAIEHELKERGEKV